MDNHEQLLGNLKTSAAPLIDISSGDVAERIQHIVEETIQAWNETSTNLSNLCEKYQRAVRLWQNYKTASEELNNWVEDKVNDLEIMNPNESLKHIKVSLILIIFNNNRNRGSQ